jgi:hypothetical protein
MFAQLTVLSHLCSLSNDCEQWAQAGSHLSQWTLGQLLAQAGCLSTLTTQICSAEEHTAARHQLLLTILTDGRPM